MYDKNLWALISEICAKQRTAATFVHWIFMLFARELEQWLFNFIFHRELDDSGPPEDSVCAHNWIYDKSDLETAIFCVAALFEKFFLFFNAQRKWIGNSISRVIQLRYIKLPLFEMNSHSIVRFEFFFSYWFLIFLCILSLRNINSHCVSLTHVFLSTATQTCLHTNTFR